MDYEAIRRIREYEFEQLRKLLPCEAGAAVLEIGAGAGWQARELAELGVEVTAIDIDESTYKEVRVFPVTTYNGSTIPLPDSSVDVVFSSNVLEHVPHVRKLQAEIARVLRPGGYAVHAMPSASWRFWTSVAHYLFVVKWLFCRVRQTCYRAASLSVPPSSKIPGTKSRSRFRLVVPYSHGEIRSAWVELWLFSRRQWTKMFNETGWAVDHVEGNKLYYSGYFIIGSKLSIQQRHRLSALLGSSCTTYVVRPNVYGGIE